MIRNIIWFVHVVAVVLAGYLLAALLPGDNVNVNVLGALFLVAVVAVLDAALTAPLKYLARRRAPVRTWS